MAIHDIVVIGGSAGAIDGTNNVETDKFRLDR
jgi:hypothetical protein